MSRYKKADIEWLLAQFKGATEDGKATVKEAATLLVDEWNKRTGGKTDADGLLGAYYRHRAKAMPPLSTGSAAAILKPGEEIVVLKNGDKFAKFAPNMDEAVAMVSGDVKNYRFFACRELIVGFKTIMVVKAK